MAMSSGHPGSGLRGRTREFEALNRLVDGVRSGRSSVLVVRGEPGVGKSALLEYVRGRASGCRIAQVGGVESEVELAFAGLHQMCSPMLERVEDLPGPQRDALRVAFGLREGAAPDRFLVGLAVLTLLSEVAAERPLVCLVDDAQWLDRASVQAMAFVARRLLADPVAVVFAVREPSDERELNGLPELVVEGLGDADARLLLASAIRGRLDERVRDRFVAETRGNPLALLELPRGLTPAEVAGGFGLPGSRPLASRIELSFIRRLESLPRETRRFLLTAAAEPVGDAGLLWRAAKRLGIGVDAPAPAEAAGLIELDARVRFRHPLVRSAAYRAAPFHERQEVHRALAEVTDPEADPDRRAWHRAHAALGPDEAVAGELERSADRARGRGGVAAAAAFLERATELTSDPARRGARALAAAQVHLMAAAPDMAWKLLATAELGPLDELQRARVERLRAQIAFARRRGSDAPPLLLTAAERLEPLDAGLARETYLEAFGAAIFAGRLSGDGVLETAGAVRAAPPARLPARPTDLLLDGLATRFTEGYAAGVPPLQGALHAFRRGHDSKEDNSRWLWLACRTATDLWDDEAWHELSTREVRLARDAGALDLLPLAVTYRAGVHVHAGEFAAASELLDEADAITEVTGNAPVSYMSLVLAAWRGQEARTVALVEASALDAIARGEGRAIVLAEYSTAVLYNGLGRYEGALAAAQRACEYDDLSFFGWALVELVEAGVRSGRPEIAAHALRRLGERTGASGTEWALGIEARSRALLSDGRAADALYREAIDRLARTRIAVHLARAHLLYGEWLRRENKRLDAREHLRTAYDRFSRFGAEAFAERARRELLATGETVRKPTAQTLAALTAQEAQIARLARDGHTNPEIGSQLFLSPRTVEWHLSKVFTKLDISSRRQLRHAL
ncbi:MAG: putative transcriptional regulator, LuxR family [Pseudonocardia sp.]|uniref:helix-turn-helix transcriptional regulator n=1 Tax=Pseudonocardia sp. TaxID=60912 RepID=UPI00260A85C8|nr:LuxR family transcriptional regulator [Pseudonocardia sp.]MCU1629059.1 putative transcriptional regulator, LuxR family [Pseudonocardia sp.]